MNNQTSSCTFLWYYMGNQGTASPFPTHQQSHSLLITFLITEEGVVNMQLGTLCGSRFAASLTHPRITNGVGHVSNCVYGALPL